MSSSSVKNIVIGAAVIAASFFVPGAPWIATTLFGIGSSFTLRGLTRLFLDDKQQGVQQNVVSTQAELPVVYGETRLGIKMVDAIIATDGDTIFGGAENEDVLIQVGALCIGSENGSGIEGARYIRFYDKIQASSSVNFLTVDTDIETDTLVAPYTDPNLTPSHWRFKYAFRSGKDSQSTPSKLISCADWTSDMKGRGIAYLACYFRYDENVYRGGIPNITVSVKGNKLYDPRNTSWAWSDNPSLCVLDYLTSKRYGLKRPYAARDGGTYDEIDQQSFIDAANFCDELVSVPGGGTQKRFRCNGFFNPAANPSEILSDLLSSCRGELIWEGGKFRIFIRKPGVATAFELTEDNIVGQIDWSRGGASVPNIMEATFIDEDQDYTAQSRVWPLSGDTAFLDADAGIENKKEIDLPFTPNSYQAVQTTMVMLREMREDMVLGVTCTEAAFQLRIGDIVPFTHSSVGFVQKEFWVVNVSLTPNQLVRLVLQEYNVDAYNLDSLAAEATVPGTSLPNPFECQPPSGLILTSDATTALDTQDYQTIPRIKGAFSKSPDPFLVDYLVEYKKSADTTWLPGPPIGKAETSFFIQAVTDNVSYDVRMCARNSIGVKSAFLTGTITASTEKAVDRDLSDWDIVDNDDGTKTFRATAGALIDRVYVYNKLYALPSVPKNPWPNNISLYTETITPIPVDKRIEYTFDDPPLQFVRKLEFLPLSTTFRTGKKVRLSIEPDSVGDPSNFPAGSVVASKMVKSAQLYNFPDSAWTKTSNIRIDWSSATLKFSDAEEYTIAAGSLSMANGNPYFIYWDKSDSTHFQTTQDFSSLGDNTVLMATALRSLNTDTVAYLGTALGMVGIPDTVINARAIQAGNIKTNTITGVEIFGTSVSGIFADFGIMTAGVIVNGGGTFLLDLDATGTDPLLVVTDGVDPVIEIFANGDATFYGKVAATQFIGATADFSGQISVYDQDVGDPPSVLGQWSLQLGGYLGGALAGTLLLDSRDLGGGLYGWGFTGASNYYFFDKGLNLPFSGGYRVIEEDAPDTASTGYRRLRIQN